MSMSQIASDSILNTSSASSRSAARTRLRRSIAVSLFALSIAVSGLSSGAVYAANAESEGFYQEAQKAMKDGKVNEAIIHIKNAVRADPSNVEAQFLLGQFNLQRGDAMGAEKAFREARQKGMPDEKVLLPLAQAYLMQGKTKELLAQIDTSTMKGEAKALGHTMRARTFLVENDMNKVREELDAARPDAAKLSVFHVADAELLYREKDLPAAEKAIDQALALEPKLIQALWLKGELRRTQKDLEGALKAYDAGIEADKNAFQIRLSRAFTLMALNRFEEAESDADTILKTSPEMPTALYIKSALLAQRGDAEKALEVLRPVEFRLTSFMPAVYLLASLNLKLNRLEGALSYAERYHAANQDRADAIKLLANVYLRQKRFPEAIKLLKPHEAEENYKADQQYLQLLGNSYLAATDYPAAARVFKELQKLSPENETIREQLAITSLGMGEQDDAVRELEAMAEGEGGSDRVNLLLILTHMRNKDYVKAQAAAEHFVKNSDKSGTAHNLLGSVLLAQEKQPEARAAFETALKVQPGFEPAILNLAQLDQMENKPKEAKDRLTAHLETNKGDEKVLTMLSSLALRENDQEAALDWLQKAASENPKSSSARLRLIDLQLKMNKPEAALQTATELNSVVTDSPEAINALAQVQIINKQIASGVASYRKLVSIAPGAPLGHLLFGQALMLNDNVAEAKQAFDEAIKLAPSMPEARVERINAELKDGGIEAAEKLALSYRDQMPDNANHHLMLGDVYMRGGKFADAAAAFEKGHQMKPSGNSMRRLYLALVRDSKEELAMKQLKAWTEKNQEDLESRLVLSTELIRKGDMDAAIAENESLNEKIPGRPVILNNLGWLYARKGDPRGIEMVRTAYELAPKAPEIQDTYGWMLVKEGKVAEGLEILRQAATALPKAAEVQYHFAAALAKNGNKPEALEILTRILATPDVFDERKDAEALLSTLKAG